MNLIYVFWNISKILASVLTGQPAKLHEVVLFNNIFVQLFWSTYGSFFLVFPSRSDICYLWYSNWFKNETSLTLEANSEAYSEPCQTSKIEVFAQIVNGF